jgi:catalase
MMERSMVDASVAKRLVQAIIDNLPEPVPGRRPVHTIGIGVKGEFVASNVARTYCIAEHFKGQTIQVSVRFSNGLGGGRSSTMDGPMFGEWRHASTCRTGRQAT